MHDEMRGIREADAYRRRQKKPHEGLWFDDAREPPSGEWIWARTVEDAQQLILESPRFEIASLDHDLGLHELPPETPDADSMRLPRRYRCYACDAIINEPAMNIHPTRCTKCGITGEGYFSEVADPTGKELATWLVTECPKHKIPEKIVVHSMNNVGAAAIAAILVGHVKTIEIVPFQRW